MTPLLAQTALQPEAIGVLVVLAVALLSLLVVGTALLRSRRRHAAQRQQRAQDQPAPDRFAERPADEVIGAADEALYQRDGRTVAAAALRLHATHHPQALPYLLHALRLAAEHHRPPLLAAAGEHRPDELAEYPLLAAALDTPTLQTLRDTVQAETATAGHAPQRRGRN